MRPMTSASSAASSSTASAPEASLPAPVHLPSPRAMCRRHVPSLTGVVRRDDWGYSAKELRDGGVKAQDLRKGRVYFRIEEWQDAAWPTRELMEGGTAHSLSDPPPC